MLPIVTPIEVMCHGDFAPYNITINNGSPYGIIDFDTLHPGPRLWDLAYAIYRWVPFTNPKNPDCYDNLEEQIRKANLFMDSYELNKDERFKLPDVMVNRLRCLIKYIEDQAKNHNEDFKKNISDGHLNLYNDDITYILKNKKSILNRII